MKQNIMYIGIVLATGLLFSQASYATDYGNYDHAQGNEFQCATGVYQQLECQIENVLKFYFPQMVTAQGTTNDRLQTIINNQQTEIDNEKTQIDLLNQLVNHFINKTVSNCIKSGTGILCG